MNQQASPKKKNQKEPEKKPVSDGLYNFAKYSGMAFQMMAIILVTTWGGVKLDKVLKLETPVFTIVLSLLGVFAAIYTSLRDFIKK
ncbi:MAG: AtpZ/AtpI family protein [Bacteroidales bacterium]|nr:AtpZ/AtpI family protein [Bacteroidales bacterium]